MNHRDTKSPFFNILSRGNEIDFCACASGAKGEPDDPHTHTHTALGCDAETTEFFFWKFTPAGTTQTLRCPTTTTMISRTCSSSGVWESVDLTLCTSFTSINTVSFMHKSGSKPLRLPEIVIFNSVRLYSSANYRAFEQFMTSSCVHNK